MMTILKIIDKLKYKFDKIFMVNKMNSSKQSHIIRIDLRNEENAYMLCHNIL